MGCTLSSRSVRTTKGSSQNELKKESQVNGNQQNKLLNYSLRSTSEKKIDYSSDPKNPSPLPSPKTNGNDEIKAWENEESHKAWLDQSTDNSHSLTHDTTPQRKMSKKISFPTGELKKIGRCASTYEDIHRVVNDKTLNQKRQDGRVSSGVVGLQNLGNTCFMNSAIQCLSNTTPLTDYFLGYDWAKEINKQNPLGMKGEVASAFGSLISKIWTGDSRAVAPTTLRQKISKFNPIFTGYQQHDAQELLAFLLDGLHEDLNRVHNKPYIEDVEADGRDDEELAMEAWKGYLQRNRSIIVDLFQGQLRNELRCNKCGHKSLKFDPFMYLSLPVERSRISKKSVDLQHCIDLFCQKEKLDGDNKWYCPKCKKFQVATKKLDVWKFPAILIIHLKRFQHDKSGRRSKLNTLVNFEIEDMDLTQYAKGPQKDDPMYDLFAVVNHHGSLGGGHYTACGKNRIDSKWYKFNDSSCSNATEDDLQSAAAYVLFYSRMVAEPCDRDPSRGRASRTRAGSTSSHEIQYTTDAEGKRQKRREAVIRRQTVNKPHLWPHFNDACSNAAAKGAKQSKPPRRTLSSKPSIKGFRRKPKKVTTVQHNPKKTKHFGSVSPRKS